MYLIRRRIHLIFNGSLIFSVRVGQREREKEKEKEKERGRERERERRLLFFLIVRVLAQKYVHNCCALLLAINVFFVRNLLE
jgi:hypothetical protein